ncbi:MAG: hypothetical protein P8Z36_08620 [Gemmatimonadota bacterium]
MLLAVSSRPFPTQETAALRHCLFCRKPFPFDGRFPRFAHGRSVAYDPERGRLWAICDGCRRWTLWPLPDRGETLDALERLVMDRGHAVAQTTNVTLVEVEDLLILRVGDAGLAEQAWWRYGRELRRRRTSFESAYTRISAYLYGAVAAVGEHAGLDLDAPIAWDHMPVADVLRWRHFGWAAWVGRTRCPNCNSVLRAIRFDLSWWLYPLPQEDGAMVLGVPCSRCDPWTPDKGYRLRGDDAEYVLRRALAYQHITGASDQRLAVAAHVIERAGSSRAFVRAVGVHGVSLRRLGPTRAVALEIALNDDVERRMLEMEVKGLEAEWRREERLAAIIDRELEPPTERM